MKKFINRLFRYFISKVYWNRTVHNFDPKWFEGKSIAIIGGADTAFLEKKGTYIDSYDVVIRINRGIDNYKSNPEYLGTRTDVLFHGLHEGSVGGCGPVKPKEWLEKGVKMVVFPLFGNKNFFELLKTYVYKSKGSLPVMQVSKESFQQVTSDLSGFRTTTGFAAIYFMTKLEYKKLYITGFTFFRTPHQKGYNDSTSLKQTQEHIKKHNFHNPDLEFEYFKSLYVTSKNIEIDKGMKELFDS